MFKDLGCLLTVKINTIYGGKKTPGCILLYLSSLFFKVLTVGASLTQFGKAFQGATTRRLKKFVLFWDWAF